jgi:hypothetical protein
MPRSETLITTAAKGSAIAALVGGLFGLVLRPDASHGVYQLGSRTDFAIPQRMHEARPGLHTPGNLLVLVSNPAQAKPQAAPVARRHVAPPAPDTVQVAENAPVIDTDAPARFTETAWRATPPQTLNEQLVSPPPAASEAADSDQ